MDPDQPGDQPTWSENETPADLLRTQVNAQYVSAAPVYSSQSAVQSLSTLQLGTDGQLQQLIGSAAPYQQVYQTQLQHYDRVGSPIQEFSQAVSSGGSIIHHIPGLSQPDLIGLQRSHVVTLPLFMGQPGSVGLPHGSLATLSGAPLQSVGVSSGIGLPHQGQVTSETLDIKVVEEAKQGLVMTEGSQSAGSMQPMFTMVNDGVGGEGIRLIVGGDRSQMTTLGLTELHESKSQPLCDSFHTSIEAAADGSFQLVSKDPNDGYTSIQSGINAGTLISPDVGQLSPNSPSQGQPGGEEDLAQLLNSAEQGTMVTGMEGGMEMPGTAGLDHSGPQAENVEGDEDSEIDLEGIGDGDDMPEQDTPVRKSARLANQDDRDATQEAMHYDPNINYSCMELWCEDCQCTYPSECERHRLQFMADKVVLSRAWASLPPQLQIFRLEHSNEIGVFAKRAIPKRTQFGPFVADFVDQPKADAPFPLQAERDAGVVYLDASDESKCNWMMFVRPAVTYSEQNLIAYQHGADIYYCAIKPIEPQTELKVWYAAHFANRLGRPTHALSQTDIQALDETDMKWPCYECNKKFRSSALLQRHLATHDENLVSAAQAEESLVRRSGRSRKKTYKSLALVGSSGQEEEGEGGATENHDVKLEDGGQGRLLLEELIEGDGNTFQSWKKRKTNLYLRLKKYKEPVKRSIRTLYKKQGKDTGGQEWVCTHCQLTFDNPSLLNLHTLTHAAEDVGLDEALLPTGHHDNTGLIPSFVPPLGGVSLACPVCNAVFGEKQELIEHAATHAKGRKRSRFSLNPRKPHKCTKCWKSFTTDERLQRHLLCHEGDSHKPMECTHCNKRFMNNSALSCHLKTHSDTKYYDCPLCHEGFDQVHDMKAHMERHKVNDVYECPECHKSFENYLLIRKHMRAFHSEQRFPCPECHKDFPRPDKLKLHMLKHSNIREFMCHLCGRQFKRKDKLKEHMKRMHGPDRGGSERRNPPGGRVQHKEVLPKKFIPKVLPTDYHRFIYKCHMCLLGFKRRGMLVNHLAKRHPAVKPDTVPELNLPILRTQRDYFCAYCSKVYRSSSKRKAHILKNHPGGELPVSARKKDYYENIGVANPTYSHPSGSVTTMPHSCEFCFKQYASKAKLLQHQRKKHTELVPALAQDRRPGKSLLIEEGELGGQRVVTAVIRPMEAGGGQDVITVQPSSGEVMQADLLTQAMTELSQTLTAEYRPASAGGNQHTEYQISPRISITSHPFPSSAGATPVTVSMMSAAGPHHHTTTLDLGSLGTTLVQQAQYQTVAPPGDGDLDPQAVVGDTTVLLPAVSGSGLPQINMVTSQPGQQVMAGAVPISMAQFKGGTWTGQGFSYR